MTYCVNRFDVPELTYVPIEVFHSGLLTFEFFTRYGDVLVRQQRAGPR